MYHFVDRPLDSLPRDRLFLIRALRVWVLAAQHRRCPCRTLAAWFDDAGVSEAMPHFRMMMSALFQDAREKLVFGLPERASVTEDEAILLALADGAVGEAHRKRASAALVKPEATAILARALGEVAAALSSSPRLQPDPFPRTAGEAD